MGVTFQGTLAKLNKNHLMLQNHRMKGGKLLYLGHFVYFLFKLFSFYSLVFIHFIFIGLHSFINGEAMTKIS